MRQFIVIMENLLTGTEFLLIGKKLVKIFYIRMNYMETQLATSTGLSDKELLQKLCTNDPEALELLYDRYSPILYTQIKKIVEDEETAEAVLTEVFIIIWKWAEHFDFTINNVYTWMIILARRKAIDTLKRKRGDAELTDYSDEYEIQNILPRLSQKIRILELDKIISKIDKISNLLNVLSIEQKEILLSVYYKGLEDRIIAEKLNIPVASVRLKLQFVMEILMKKLYK